MSDNFTHQWNCLDNHNHKSSNGAVSIPSSCPSIDKLFFPIFKGIPLKNITEIVGLPGTGKTCLAYENWYFRIPKLNLFLFLIVVDYN